MKIAIAGKMGSGKSTCAKHLQEINPQFQKFSFASKVKELATDLFGMTTKDRSLLTSIGKKMRDIDPDVWANWTFQESLSSEYAVIDDLRHFNEYRILKDNGWKIIKLEISEQLQKQRLQKISTPEEFQDHLDNMNDISEQQIVNSTDDYFDLVIHIDNEQENSVLQKIEDFYNQECSKE